jgi:hypothetical protein
VYFALALLIAAALVLAFGSTMRAAETGAQLGALAAWWETADAALRAQAGQPVTVTLPRPPGTLGTLRVLSAGAGEWPNHCIARYFGVAAVVMDG